MSSEHKLLIPIDSKRHFVMKCRAAVGTFWTGGATMGAGAAADVLVTHLIGEKNIWDL